MLDVSRPCQIRSACVRAPCALGQRQFRCSQVLSLRSGQQMRTLRGHLETANACAWNAVAQECYTGGNDSQVLAWAPGSQQDADEDAWSD